MTNNFKTKKIDLLTLGEQLRKVRKEQDISLEQASKITKIQIKYLNYLENGQYEKLPADVYVKSFLKSYASFLKMDSENAIAFYKKEKKIGEKLERAFFKKSKAVSENSPDSSRTKFGTSFYKIPFFAITPKVLIFGLSIIIIAAISIYFFYQISFLTEPPKLIIETPAEDLIIKEEKILIKGKTQVNAEVSINGGGVWLDENGAFNQELLLQEGINVIKIIAVNKFGRKNEITRKIIYEK